MIVVAKPCGPCSLCCKLMKIEQLDKPANQWCKHYEKGRRCTIHAMRPAFCADYYCGWSLRPELDERWRPDNAKFILNLPKGQLIIQCDPSTPGAWQRAPYYAQIKKWSERHSPQYTTVLVRTQGRLICVFPEADIDLGPYRESVPIDSGYQLVSGRMIPYARYVEPPRRSVES
jgi:hypothetical protein